VGFLLSPETKMTVVKKGGISVRKRIKISATIVILFCLLVAIPAVSIADDYEPDDIMAVARWITVGNEFQNHEIDPATDTDWVKFEAIEGYGYVIELANESAGNVYCHLYNENGNLLISSIDTHKEWLCPLTGTYYLMIWENGQNNVCSYQVRILPAYWNGTAVWNSDYEPDDNWYSAYLIRTDGTVYHHDNSNAADFDWVRFTAEEGRTYTFSLTNETGGNYHFDVYDAGYRGISGSQSNIWTWTCPNSGTYYVRMWEYQQNQIGTFDFRIISDEVDYAINLPISHVTLYLDTAYGVDSYQLVANCSNGSNDIVWSSTDSSVVTVDTDGLLEAQGVGTAHVTATCTISGTSDDVIVTVNADDYENNDAQVQAKPISVGIEYQSHQLTPNSSDPDQFDWVKFDAVEGCGYVIELANESAGDVYCNLYNENGDAVTGTISTRQEWLCPFTGTYYLRIWENGHNHWTSYQVRILPAYWNGTAVWDGEYEPDDNWYNAYLIRTDGTVYHHANSNAADFDWVRFTAEEGRTYTFSLTNETGGNYYFDLYDAGYRGLSGSQTNIWTWTCPISGTYYVRMWEYQHNQIGTFDFRIISDEVDYAINLPISHVTLYLDTAYGVDSYQLVANCSNGSDDIVWSSSDSSVVSVSSSGMLQAQGVGTATVTATCTVNGMSDDIIVTVNQDDYEPNDALALAKPILVGNNYQTHLLKPNGTDPDQYDWVKFDAVEGCGYVIELANESGGNVYCRLYNENGNSLSGNINTRQEWKCPFTGTYYLQIWDYSLDQWTSCQVRVLPAYWNGTAVWDSNYEPDDNWYSAYLIRTDGTVYHHANSNAADFDWVRFTAEEGRTYTFSSNNETGGNYYFVVYDAWCRGLSGNQNTNWTWTCPVTGTYYVRMWDYSSDQAGTFDFSVISDVVDYSVDIPTSHVTLYLDTAYGVDSYQLVANCSNGSDDIVWSSSDSSVVSVSSSGMLQAQGVGTATVTATCTVNGMSDDIIVTVNQDDYEPNDAQALAKPISVGNNYQTHLLKPNGTDLDQYDWVKFDAVEGYGYVIELANESGGNVYCHLYDEDGNSMSGNINTRQEWKCPSTGTYYLQIWDYSLDQWTSYQVRVLPAYWNGTAVWDSEYEANDTGYTACFICTDNSPQHSHNEECDDFDWFRFYAVQDSTYVLSLTNELGGNFYFILYDNKFAAISGSQNTNMPWTCPTTGLYHVRIWEYGTDQIGSYDFSIDGEPIAVDSDGDGMNDCWEIFYFGIGNLNRDGTGDWDGDGLSDKGEFDNGTHPKDVDTDDDNMPDGWEVDNGLNPLVNDAFDDKDGDGFCNWREYRAGTDPDDSGDIPDNIDIYVDDDNTSGIEDGTKENPFNTAQEGVNFSGPGDIVYVAAGTYVENVLIKKSISLIGDGADVTIIDGSGSAQPAVCMTLAGGIIEEFHIRNGTDAGIQCEQSLLSIRENIISNTSSGHGIEIDTGSSVTIENNIIYDNDLHGIDFQGVAATIMNNTIVSNKGDGIGCTSGDGVMIENNIIVSNGEYGISCDQSPEPQISYNDVWDNTIGDYSGCSPGTGDISGNPLFEDSVIYDFHITTGSPCIDAGTSDGVPEFDFDGNCRYDDPNAEPNTGGGTDTYYDMGAYEYFPVCKGDFDSDGDVDGSDLVIFADAFGSSSGGPDYNPVTDFDGDGYVDESDLAVFAAEFGRTDCPICP